METLDFPQRVWGRDLIRTIWSLQSVVQFSSVEPTSDELQSQHNDNKMVREEHSTEVNVKLNSKNKTKSIHDYIQHTATNCSGVQWVLKTVLHSHKMYFMRKQTVLIYTNNANAISINTDGSALSRPTNAQHTHTHTHTHTHIYIYIYRKRSYMFRCICIVFRESYPCVLLNLQKSFRLQTLAKEKEKTPCRWRRCVETCRSAYDI